MLPLGSSQTGQARRRAGPTEDGKSTHEVRVLYLDPTEPVLEGRIRSQSRGRRGGPDRNQENGRSQCPDPNILSRKDTILEQESPRSRTQCRAGLNVAPKTVPTQLLAADFKVRTVVFDEPLWLPMVRISRHVQGNPR